MTKQDAAEHWVLFDVYKNSEQGLYTPFLVKLCLFHFI